MQRQQNRKLEVFKGVLWGGLGLSDEKLHRVTPCTVRAVSSTCFSIIFFACFFESCLWKSYCTKRKLSLSCCFMAVFFFECSACSVLPYIKQHDHPWLDIARKQKVTRLVVKKVPSTSQLGQADSCGERRKWQERKNNRTRKYGGREIPEPALGKAECWD